MINVVYSILIAFLLGKHVLVSVLIISTSINSLVV